MDQEFLKQSVFISGLVLLRYFVFAGFFFALFYGINEKYRFIKKIQEKFPAWKDYQRDILYSISSSIIFGVFFTLVIFYLQPYTQVYEDIGKFGMPYYVLSYFLMVLIHDSYFYWSHKLIHHPKLFKKVHLVHHKATNPTPWTSLAFHPWEALVQALVIPLIAFAIPVHKFALIFYFIFQLAHNIYGHLGYELVPRFVRKNYIGKFLNTSVYHNHHHKNFKSNYGLFFTFWDRWMGTLEEEEETEAKLKPGKLELSE